MTADRDDVIDQGIPRRRGLLILGRNVLRFYAIFGILMVVLLTTVGLFEDSTGIPRLLDLLPLLVPMLPGVALGCLIAYALPVGRSRVARLIAVLDLGACAYLGTALAAVVATGLTGVAGIWSTPIFVAGISGMLTGLVAEARPPRR
jgi:hypothetical protein